MVRALPPLKQRPPAIDSNAPVVDPVTTWRGGGNLALGDVPQRGGPAGNGELQVYDPTEPTKPWRGASPNAGPSLFEQERESARKDNLHLCCKMCVFFVYLIIFTCTMLFEQGRSPARLADHMQATLDGGPVPLLEVSSTAQLYDYIERSFIPAVFGPTVDRTSAAQQSSSLVPLDLSNRLLGTVRVRQLRVDLRSGCQVSPMFKAYSISCYPAYTPSTEATASFGSGGTSYGFSTDSSGTNFPGKFGSYGPNGYTQLLRTNASDALADVAALRRSQFLDAATRAVFLEFTVWSSNVATYASVIVLVEFGATGTVNQQVRVLTLTEGALRPGGIGTAVEWLGFMGVIVVVIFNLYFMFEEMQEIWVSRWKYFLDAWNVLDWLNMILLMAAFVFRSINFVEASGASIGQQALGNSMSFTNLSAIAFRAHMVNMFHAVNAAVLWGTAVKYLRFMPLVKEIVFVVWKAFDLFLPFVCMFTVAFVGFAMAYNIGFGDKISELSTFYMSAVYLGRAFLRDIKLMNVYNLASPIFAATLILLYYVTLILVGASFLFAIIADALYHAKFKTDERPNPYHRDEPCEEFGRWLRVRFPCLFWPCNWCRRRMSSKRRNKQEQPPPGAKAGALAAIKGADLIGFDDTSVISSRSQLALPSRGELMRAVELMSGRILSEISIVGIEIRSELHEICERVAQMQMAVEELTHRAEKVRQEQEVNQLTN